jgi:hypothetical protein
MFSWNLREATRSVHVSYPVPFIATLLIVGGLCLIGAARLFDGAERAILLAIGCFTITAANVIVVWAVFFKPELLKSAGFSFLDKMIAVVGDSTMDPAATERLHAAMIGVVADLQSGRPKHVSRPNPSGSSNEGDEQ